MKITDAITITELSRLLQKSRPTVYKYISDYEQNDYEAIPFAVRELFRLIDEEDLSRDDIVSYCKTRFGVSDIPLSADAIKAIDYIKTNQDAIDFHRLEKYLRKVTR